MSRGFGARQRTMLKTMEAAMRYEWHHGALAPPLCRSQIDHLFVRPFQSRISPQLFGNEAPTGAISDNPFLSERGSPTALPAIPFSSAPASVALQPPASPARAPSHTLAPSPTVSTAARSVSGGQSQSEQTAAGVVGSHTCGDTTGHPIHAPGDAASTVA
jgi:hypothetical protein